MTACAPIAVALATYNNGGTIEQAVRSIIDQTYTEWELILIDDGSTDSTYEICQELASEDSRIRLVTMPRNVGLATALNIALSLTESLLVARMDGDDISEPTRLLLQREYMRHNPDVAVLGTAATLRSPHAATDGQLFVPPQDHETLYRRRYKSCPVLHPTVMYRRSLVSQANGYDPRAVRCEDFDLWLRLMRNGLVFSNLQEPLVRYTVPEFISVRQTSYVSYMLTSQALSERSVRGAGYAAAFALRNLGFRAGIGRLTLSRKYVN